MDLESQNQIQLLTSSVRFLAAALAVGLGVFNIALAFFAFLFHLMFASALPGQTLPLVTEFVTQWHILWLLIAISLPSSAVLTAVFVRSHRNALSSISLIVVGICLQSTIAWAALLSPMIRLVNRQSNS